MILFFSDSGIIRLSAMRLSYCSSESRITGGGRQLANKIGAAKNRQSDKVACFMYQRYKYAMGQGLSNICDSPN